MLALVTARRIPGPLRLEAEEATRRAAPRRRARYLGNPLVGVSAAASLADEEVSFATRTSRVSPSGRITSANRSAFHLSATDGFSHMLARERESVLNVEDLNRNSAVLLKVLYAVSLRARAAMYLWSRPYLTSVLMSACLLIFNCFAKSSSSANIS